MKLNHRFLFNMVKNYKSKKYAKALDNPLSL